MEHLTYAQTKPYLPPVQSGKVIKVYDGDTFTLGVFVDEVAYRFSVRMKGIDSPEMRGPHKDLAIQSRDALTELIMHKIVRLENIGTEKFGRVLADVYVDNVHVNAWMIEKGHAKSYDGGKKT
jgi:micrococcal nuclease